MMNTVPLLLLPGLMNDARVWDPVRQALPAGRDVLVSPTDGADTIEALAATALAAMPDGSFALAGFSLGGYVALEVCRQAGARIAGLALLDTGARADPPEATRNRQRMVAALSSGGASFAQVVESFTPRVLHPAHAQDRALLELLADMARQVGGEGFTRQQKAAMQRRDARELLPALTAPALVLCGREDQITPPALSEEMVGLLPGDVELVVVPQCGHMSTLEQPVAVAEAFLRWLARVDAVASPTRGG
jgi:pimeloyl-ACP methyl ester carboxylesterase